MTLLSQSVSEKIATAVQMLESGLLVAFPTETVYGLGADAENPQAVQKIFSLKGRPPDRPLSINVPVDADLSYWVASIPSVAQKLIDAFWPGPLTLVLPKSRQVPETISRGMDSVALRCPSHPLAVALLKAFRSGKGGIAAPSANKSGHISPTTAQHVRNDFWPDERLGMILDGGSCDLGIESTILDLSSLDIHEPKILRPGSVSAEQIAEVIGISPVQATDASLVKDEHPLKHYAPQKPAMLVSMQEINQILQHQAGYPLAVLSHSTGSLAQRSLTASQDIKWISMPDDPAGYSRQLYAVLHKLDNSRITNILIESVPETAEWTAVRNRLSGITEIGQVRMAQLLNGI